MAFSPSTHNSGLAVTALCYFFFFLTILENGVTLDLTAIYSYLPYYFDPLEEVLNPEQI